MRLVPAVLALFFQLLVAYFSANEAIVSRHIRILNGLVYAASSERSVDTIVYFGVKNDIAPYVHRVAPKIPTVILTRNQGFGSLRFRHAAGFSSNIFFIAFGSLNDTSNWSHLREAFKYMQHHIRGVFVTSTVGDNFHEHFSWCWRSGYADVLALVFNGKGFQGFCYTPFPEIQIYSADLTRPSNVSCFQNNFRDLRGYKMRTALQYDPPRVFRAPRRNLDLQGDWPIRGYAGVMFLEFLNKHNAVLHIVRKHNKSDQNILGIIKQLNDGNIDMSMNPYLAYPGVRISYPLRMMHWSILVPSSHELRNYQYFLRPFQASMWLACAGIMFYFAICWSLSGYLWRKMRRGSGRLRFIRNLLEAFRLMIYQPMPAYRGYVHWAYAFIFCLVVPIGFILTNVYLALLTSYLAKVIFEPQLDSLAEVVARNLSINAMAHEIPIILKNRGLPKGFAALLKQRNATHMVNDILALNKSAAFAAREDLMEFSLVQQAFESKPRFHIAKEFIATVPVGYLMPSHSQFKRTLNRFILRASAAGLVDKWFQDTIHDGFSSGILHLRRDRIKYPLPLTLDHFQFAWLVLLGGFTLASLAFLLENASIIGCRLRCLIWRRR